jgi:outer membrane lipoprotein SlyB
MSDWLDQASKKVGNKNANSVLGAIGGAAIGGIAGNILGGSTGSTLGMLAGGALGAANSYGRNLNDQDEKKSALDKVNLELDTANNENSKLTETNKNLTSENENLKKQNAEFGDMKQLQSRLNQINKEGRKAAQDKYHTDLNNYYIKYGLDTDEQKATGKLMFDKDYDSDENNVWKSNTMTDTDENDDYFDKYRANEIARFKSKSVNSSIINYYNNYYRNIDFSDNKETFYNKHRKRILSTVGTLVGGAALGAGIGEALGGVGGILGGATLGAGAGCITSELLLRDKNNSNTNNNVNNQSNDDIKSGYDDDFKDKSKYGYDEKSGKLRPETEKIMKGLLDSKNIDEEQRTAVWMILKNPKLYNKEGIRSKLNKNGKYMFSEINPYLDNTIYSGIDFSDDDKDKKTSIPGIGALATGIASAYLGNKILGSQGALISGAVGASLGGHFDAISGKVKDSAKINQLRNKVNNEEFKKFEEKEKDAERWTTDKLDNAVKSKNEHFNTWKTNNTNNLTGLNDSQIKNLYKNSKDHLDTGYDDKDLDDYEALGNDVDKQYEFIKNKRSFQFSVSNNNKTRNIGYNTLKYLSAGLAGAYLGNRFGRNDVRSAIGAGIGLGAVGIGDAVHHAWTNSTYGRLSEHMKNTKDLTRESLDNTYNTMLNEKHEYITKNGYDKLPQDKQDQLFKEHVGNKYGLDVDTINAYGTASDRDEALRKITSFNASQHNFSSPTLRSQSLDVAYVKSRLNRPKIRLFTNGLEKQYGDSLLRDSYRYYDEVDPNNPDTVVSVPHLPHAKRLKRVVLGSNIGSLTGTVLGGVAGGLIGNKLGFNTVGSTAIGAGAGGLLGGATGFLGGRYGKMNEGSVDSTHQIAGQLSPVTVTDNGGNIIKTNYVVPGTKEYYEK